jgi:CBS domain containing-hemolysin-like protein
MKFLKRLLRPKRQSQPEVNVGPAFDQEEGFKPQILTLLECPEIKDIVIRLAEFEQKEVREIMVPRDRVVAIQKGATLREFVEKSIDSGYSKLPVFRETLDEILGVAFLKDILNHYGFDIPQNEPVVNIIRPALFVPEVKRAFGLLKSFQEKGTTLAIVVDEFGSTAGVVTAHDLMEELFGDLAASNGNDEEKDYVSLPKGGFEVLARVSLEELMDEAGINLEKPQGIETLNGLLSFHLGRVPKTGEKVELFGYRFLTLEADPKKAIKVRVEPLSAHQSS